MLFTIYCCRRGSPRFKELFAACREERIVMPVVSVEAYAYSIEKGFAFSLFAIRCSRSFKALEEMQVKLHSAYSNDVTQIREM